MNLRHQMHLSFRPTDQPTTRQTDRQTNEETRSSCKREENNGNALPYVCICACPLLETSRHKSELVTSARSGRVHRKVKRKKKRREINLYSTMNSFLRTPRRGRDTHINRKHPHKQALRPTTYQCISSSPHPLTQNLQPSTKAASGGPRNSRHHRKKSSV